MSEINDGSTPEGAVFGRDDPEVVARHFGIDSTEVEELQLLAGKIVDLRRHPSAQTNFGSDDTDLFKNVQLRGGVYEG